MADNTWFEGANNPGAGDLGQMQALHDNLANTAEAARRARADLAGLKDHVTDAVWRGRAAEEFKNNVSDKFLGQLQKLDASYQQAADGFSGYIAAVSQIKERAQSLASRIYAAQSRYETAAGNLQGWANAHPDSVAWTSGSLDAPGFGAGSPFTVHYTAAAVPGADAAAATAAASAQQSHAALQAEVHDAWGQLQSLYRQMDDLKTNDRAAADHAVMQRLDHAHDAGIKNESGWHHFFHTLSTIAKWVGVALIVVAVVAVVCLVLFTPVGLMGALAAVTSIGMGGSLGALVIYGGALASAAALTGDLGQQFTEGDKPGWTAIGIDAVGIVPGLGKAGSLIRELGGPADRLVSAIDSGVATGKLATAYKLENLIDKAVYTGPGIKYAGLTGTLEKWALAGDKALLQYGENKPVDSTFGAVLFGLKKTNGLWTGAAKLLPGLGITSPIALATTGVKTLQTESSLEAQLHAAELRAADPAAAAHAHDVAANLAQGKGGAYSYPALHGYPQAVATP